MLQKAASVRGILIVVAILLAANLVVALLPGSRSSVTLISKAGAQQQGAQPAQNSANKVAVVQGFTVANMKEVVSLGDGRTFVVSNENGFMVYQVEANTR